MAIVKTQKSSNYAQVHNKLLQDQRLTFKARGVAAFLLSQPDEWRINSNEIQNFGIEGRDAVRKALKELEELGYLYRKRYQEKSSGQWKTETILCDIPNRYTEDGFSGVGGIPEDGLSDAGKPVPIKKKEKKENTPATADANNNPNVPSSTTKVPSHPQHGGTDFNDQELRESQTPTPPIVPPSPASHSEEAEEGSQSKPSATLMTTIMDCMLELEPTRYKTLSKKDRQTMWGYIQQMAKAEVTPALLREVYHHMKGGFWSDKPVSIKSLKEHTIARLDHTGKSNNGIGNMVADTGGWSFIGAGDVY